MWGWLMQDRAANFDDYGPVTCRDFLREMQKREQAEVISMAYIEDHNPVGIMTALPITSRLWTTHGICFTKSVHGTGIPLEAMRQFLDLLWLKGAQKVCASYFADNERVDKFLRKLGAQREGVRLDHTLRNGKPTDMIDVAFFRFRGNR